MTSKVFEISRGNLSDAIELYLRQNSLINDDQTVTALHFTADADNDKDVYYRAEVIPVRITLKQEATVIHHNGT